MAITPTIVEVRSDAFLRYTRKPKAIAITINIREIMAVVAFAALAATSTAPSGV